MNNTFQKFNILPQSGKISSPPQHSHSTKFFLPPPKFNLSPPAPPLNSTIDLSLLQYYLLLSSNSFNVQYLQIVVFSFEKTLNDQKHSSSDSRQPIKQSLSPQQNFSFLPLLYPPLTVISDFCIPPVTLTLFENRWRVFKLREST